MRIYPKGQSSKYCKVCGEYFCHCPSLPSEKELQLFDKNILQLFIFMVQDHLKVR